MASYFCFFSFFRVKCIIDSERNYQLTSCGLNYIKAIDRKVYRVFNFMKIQIFNARKDQHTECGGTRSTPSSWQATPSPVLL